MYIIQPRFAGGIVFWLNRHISSALKPVLASDCILCTDSSEVMRAAARKIGITHRAVNLVAGIRVVVRVYHVQNVNAYINFRQIFRRTYKKQAGLIRPVFSSAVIPELNLLR